MLPLSSLPMPALMMIVLGGLMLTGYVVISLTNAYVSRMNAEKSGSKLPSDVDDRLRRMENTLDSLSIEMERLSESQRFTAKLLADTASKASVITSGKRPDFEQ